MIHVRAHARLHFGLLNPAPGAARPNLDSDAEVPPRRFGGVGLMIDEPSLVLRAEPADAWSATGPMARRALEMARGYRDQRAEPLAITVESAIPEHAGFGSGTQLGLAVAKAIAVASGRTDWDAIELARGIGRGLRSAVGVHGFDRGGLIVEAGKRGDEPVAPLVAYQSLPEAWRVVVVLPDCSLGMHGGAETAAFDKLSGDTDVTDALWRLVLLDMLPALREADYRAFGEAVYDFNARVGEVFAAAQGGRYADPLCGEIVRFIRGSGVAGVGQSSWGPALFAIVEGGDRAVNLATLVRERFGDRVKTWVTKPAGPAGVTTA
jgi:beta-ribofuranosylaminobenzene 5'-phosphate synthase